jgi:uncharacterized membrane protein YqjE
MRARPVRSVQCARRTVVILLAILSLLSRSAGKLVNAVFGWAVVALFGRTSRAQHRFLMLLVALAAFWPLAVLGVVLPRSVAFAVAFVPVLSSASATTVRIVWGVLALAVPIVVGMAMAAKVPADRRTGNALVRLWRGVPVTIAIAGAFVLMFVTVPILRIVSAVRRRTDEHLPLLVAGPEYDAAAQSIDIVLHRHGVRAARATAPWWLAAPTALLRVLGRGALGAYLPPRPAYWRGPELEIALYMADVLIRGRPRAAVQTHGLLAEALAPGPGLSTQAPAAQALERQLQRLWRVFGDDPVAHTDSARLLGRLDEVVRELARTDLPYDQWQLLYQKCQQLGRTLTGQAQLLHAALHDAGASAHVTNRMHDPLPRPPSRLRPLAGDSTRHLVSEAVQDAVALLRTEARLATSELRADVRRELGAAKRFGIAAVCALSALNLLLLAGVLAVIEHWAQPAWLVALVFAGAVLLLGGVFFALGRARHVKTPLERTRRSVEEDMRWIKERLA